MAQDKKKIFNIYRNFEEQRSAEDRRYAAMSFEEKCSEFFSLLHSGGAWISAMERVASTYPLRKNTE